VFQFVHRADHVREVMKVIKELRLSPDLAKNLGIDEVKIGRSLCQKEKQNGSFDEEVAEVTDE